MCAQFLERRIRCGRHEGLEGLKALDSELGRRAASMWFGGNTAGSALAGEEIADTTQTEPEARGALPH